MKKLLITVAVLLCFIVTGFSQTAIQIKRKEADAIKVMKEWLLIVDGRDYAKSWKETGVIFQKQVTDAQWSAALVASRTPFGKTVSRAEDKAEYKTQVPGAPDGEYVIATFKTSFEKKKDSIETVSAVFEGGQWKVVGYFIK